MGPAERVTNGLRPRKRETETENGCWAGLDSYASHAPSNNDVQKEANLLECQNFKNMCSSTIERITMRTTSTK